MDACSSRSSGAISGHAWLEWRDETGCALFSIDPTLHQFEEWAAPFVGEGPTPAAVEFTELRWAGVIWDWPHLGTETEIFQHLIRAVQEELRQSQ